MGFTDKMVTTFLKVRVVINIITFSPFYNKFQLKVLFNSHALVQTLKVATHEGTSRRDWSQGPVAGTGPLNTAAKRTAHE